MRTSVFIVVELACVPHKAAVVQPVAAAKGHEGRGDGGEIMLPTAADTPFGGVWGVVVFVECAHEVVIDILEEGGERGLRRGLGICGGYGVGWEEGAVGRAGNIRRRGLQLCGIIGCAVCARCGRLWGALFI
jgi:hypothetical protein